VTFAPKFATGVNVRRVYPSCEVAIFLILILVPIQVRICYESFLILKETIVFKNFVFVDFRFSTSNAEFLCHKFSTLY